MVGHVYTIIRTDTKEIRGTIFMPLEEAWLFLPEPLGISIVPHPREIPMESEGWISVKEQLPPLGQVVKLWGLSECNEKGILELPRTETLAVHTFSLKNSKERYLWRDADDKDGLWNHKLVTYWMPINEHSRAS